MLAFSVPDMKLFMAHLLTKETFDRLHVRSVEVTTSIHYFIDCGTKKDYYTPEEQAQLDKFSYWKDLRPLVFQLVKGNRLPLLLKVVLSADEHYINRICPEAAAMFLNITYTGVAAGADPDPVDAAQGNAPACVFCTTGASEKSFSLEKRAVAAWDDYVIKFFAHYALPISIAYE